jgi:hypothetical protein
MGRILEEDKEQRGRIEMKSERTKRNGRGKEE